VIVPRLVKARVVAWVAAQFALVPELARVFHHARLCFGFCPEHVQFIAPAVVGGDHIDRCLHEASVARSTSSLMVIPQASAAP
jgi:hypothetical protein